MAKKVITVFGATGAQGGSVVDIFVNDPKLKEEWQVRGVTRDVSKDSAKALVAKGAEVVSADLNHKDTLVKAMTGATVVYGMTNYWDSMDMQTEIKQGKDLADAAKEAGVSHYIWASLYNIKERSGGKLPNVYHFDSKAIVADYVVSLGIPTSFFLPGFYMSNLPGGMLRQSPPDNAWTLGLPIPPSSPLPLFDAAADTGKFIKAIVLNKEATLGKNVLGSSGYVTTGEVLETFKKLYPEAGATARYFEIPHDTFRQIMKNMGRPDYVAEEMLENMRLCDEFGYYFGESLDWSQSLVTEKLTTWEEHAKNAKAWKDLK